MRKGALRIQTTFGQARNQSFADLAARNWERSRTRRHAGRPEDFLATPTHPRARHNLQGGRAKNAPPAKSADQEAASKTPRSVEGLLAWVSN